MDKLDMNFFTDCKGVGVTFSEEILYDSCLWCGRKYKEPIRVKFCCPECKKKYNYLYVKKFNQICKDIPLYD